MSGCIAEVQLNSAFTPRNIKSGWAKAGLFPFDPNKVLKDIKKPKVIVQVPQLDTAIEPPPSAPLQTPLTSEALKSLRNLIEQGIDVSDNTGKMRLQKLGNAAEKAFAQCALLHDENKLLFEQNNEAKSRVAAKSTVVGKAKVMSYEDIVNAQRKRDAKKASTGSRSGQTGKRRGRPPTTKAAEKSRNSEPEDGVREIKTSGLVEYSIMQF